MSQCPSNDHPLQQWPPKKTHLSPKTVKAVGPNHGSWPPLPSNFLALLEITPRSAAFTMGMLVEPAKLPRSQGPRSQGHVTGDPKGAEKGAENGSLRAKMMEEKTLKIHEYLHDTWILQGVMDVAGTSRKKWNPAFLSQLLAPKGG